MILITGSTGLLGGHLLYALLQKYDRVAALKRPSAKTETLREIFGYYTKDPDPVLERIDWRSGDMLEKEPLFQNLSGISIVINCAAMVSFDPRERKRLIANNVLATKNLGEAIKRQEEAGQKILLIHISSTSALGDGTGDDPEFLIDEETPRDPLRRHTGYSISKYESELALRETGVNAVILNPGIILGPGQWHKGSSQLFAKAWQGLKFYPYGGTGYVDVRDVAGIIIEIIDQISSVGYPVLKSSVLPVLQSSNQQRFCLIGANLRYRDFFNRVTDEFGKPNPSVYAGSVLSGLAWRADTFLSWIAGRNPLLTRETAGTAHRISFYSSEKVRKTLGYQFRQIEETIDWVAGCYRKTVDQ